ncbi:MAG: hypothetical protein ACFFG0_01700 [Candidatus Thorarchaeota archaeon]
MSEKSQEILLSNMVEPPETDSDEFEIEQRFDKAIYESSKTDLIDHIGNDDFSYVWFVSKDDVIKNSIKRQVIFAEQIMDKINEVYDFTFSEKPSLESNYDLDNFYSFLEFIEFRNTNFLSYVWKIINPKNLMNLDIETYCKNNAFKIINEVEEQLDVHPQPKLISSFLSSLYKDAFIEWFIKNTKRSLIDIQVKILT